MVGQTQNQSLLSGKIIEDGLGGGVGELSVNSSILYKATTQFSRQNSVGRSGRVSKGQLRGDKEEFATQRGKNISPGRGKRM